ncbi:hypothetical protein ACFXPI_04520 [Streptomyces sp. NPDC059104]|uniref:hypothetical protein n=1 Tax=Streptomyces sp. NPDC059104 TaxID=3346729 RepID=UPI00368F212F
MHEEPTAVADEDADGGELRRSAATWLVPATTIPRTVPMPRASVMACHPARVSSGTAGSRSDQAPATSQWRAAA